MRLYLKAQITKSEQDQFGNTIFVVEASNEDVDSEGEKVLQRALLNSKQGFLSSGVISKDHKHRKIEDGRISIDEKYIIGEPTEVFTEGKKTYVKGKLYRHSEMAQPFIDLMRSGSTRVKASIGGHSPRKRKMNGANIVNRVTWDDLALTIVPVNKNVSPAGIVGKSFTGGQFVKAISAGYGTEHKDFSNVRALTKESLEGTIKNIIDKKLAAGYSTVAIQKMLLENGYPAKIINMALGGKTMSRKQKSWSELKKALEEEMGEDQAGDDNPADKFAPDGNEYGDRIRNGYSDGDDGDDGDGDEYEDATPVLKAMAEQVEEQRENTDVIVKSLEHVNRKLEESNRFNKSLGAALLQVMEKLDSVTAKIPQQRKSAISSLERWNKAETTPTASLPGGGLDEAAVKEILSKAATNGTLEPLKVVQYETELNQALQTGNVGAIGEGFKSFIKSAISGSNQGGVK